MTGAVHVSMTAVVEAHQTYEEDIDRWMLSAPPPTIMCLCFIHSDISSKEWPIYCKWTHMDVKEWGHWVDNAQGSLMVLKNNG